MISRWIDHWLTWLDQFRHLVAPVKSSAADTEYLWRRPGSPTIKEKQSLDLRFVPHPYSEEYREEKQNGSR